MPNNQTTYLQTRTYSDFDISFTPHPITGDLLKVTGINSIVQSVMNLVQTNHYERPFHPAVGGNVRKLLFELADPTTAQLLSEEIKDVLANYEPRATVIDVLVQSIQQEGYSITIVFSVAGITTPISITTFLARTR